MGHLDETKQLFERVGKWARKCSRTLCLPELRLCLAIFAVRRTPGKPGSTSNPQLVDINLDELNGEPIVVLDGNEIIKEGNGNLIYWTQYLDAI